MITRSAEYAARGSALFARVIPLAILLALGACRRPSPTAPTASSTLRRVVYVSTTGNNGSAGTIDAPWLTLSYAVAQLHAGDTLYIRGGTYVGGANVINSALSTVRGGTSWSNPITIAGYQSETATIQHPDGTAGIQLTSGTQQYIVFQDLIVDGINGTNNGISAIVYIAGGANHIRFLRAEIKNAFVSGVNIYSTGGNSPFNEVVSSKIHDNGRNPGVNTGYGLYIDATDNLFQGNEVYSNGGYGFVVYNDRNTIQGNTIHGNGTHGGTNYGIDIGARVSPHSDANVVKDNMIYGNLGGILVYTYSSNTSVSNNTIYDNTPLEGIRIEFATGTVLTDNLVYGNGTDVINLGKATVLGPNRR